MQSVNTSLLTSEAKLLWDLELIRRYDLSGPRYTSYPTAPQFQQYFSEDTLRQAFKRSNHRGGPLSLYFHIPFCDTVCYYCACNKIVTANKQKAEPYLQRLHQELALKAESVDSARKVTQLHWGGGTPTFISHEQMQALMRVTRQYFSLLDDDSGEYSVEVHPGNIAAGTLEVLRSLGFNRLSMGVQDFNRATQIAVNRFNSVEEVAVLTEKARALKFHSVSMDLIYGLPHQSVATLSDTLEKIIMLSPDRISLFNYAHLPHMFKTQRQIDNRTLPESTEKLAMLQQAIQTLSNAGYLFIGMDHFAKPSDDLSRVQAKGELKRNFQGYSTHGDCDLLAFGISAISAIDNVYVQNVKTLDEYYDAIDSKHLPLARGLSLNEDDRIRQQVINELICHFKLDFARIEQQFGIQFRTYFQSELKALEPLAEDALLDLHEDGIVIKPQGRLLVRRVCMLFDAYLTRQPEVRYSRII